MKHQEFIEKTSGYINGDLSETESADYETHFFNCLACRDHLLAQQAVFSTVREVIESGGMEKAEEILGLKSMLERIKSSRMTLPERKPIESELHSGILQEGKKALAKVVRSLESSLIFSYRLAPLLDVRDGTSREGKYAMGDTILLEFEPPRNMDGYLTVFHYDEQDNVEVIFPKTRADVLFLARDEDRTVQLTATEPKGKHYVKAVLTSRQIVETGLVGSKDALPRLTEQLLTSLNSVREDEWAEAVAEFEVV